MRSSILCRCWECECQQLVPDQGLQGPLCGASNWSTSKAGEGPAGKQVKCSGGAAEVYGHCSVGSGQQPGTCVYEMHCAGDWSGTAASGYVQVQATDEIRIQGQLLGRLSVWAQLLLGSTLELHFCYIDIYINICNLTLYNIHYIYF